MNYEKKNVRNCIHSNYFDEYFIVIVLLLSELYEECPCLRLVWFVSVRISYSTWHEHTNVQSVPHYSYEMLATAHAMAQDVAQHWRRSFVWRDAYETMQRMVQMALRRKCHAAQKWHVFHDFIAFSFFFIHFHFSQSKLISNNDSMYFIFLYNDSITFQTKFQQT